MPRTISRYKIIATLKPGQKGTRRLTAQYGSRLHCVRYINDKITGRNFKTVELIHEDTYWLPSQLADNEFVAVPISFHDSDLRARAKQLGARWDKHDKLWIIPYKHLSALGLQNCHFRIREEAPPPYLT